jgi:hypothetical protein
MLNSFAMMHAGFAAGTQSHPIHPARHCSGNKALSSAAIFGIFPRTREPIDVLGVFYRGAARQVKFPASIRHFPDRTAETSMTITAAHIQPIVALIAGVLILIMPRFLNLVVAIYLIFIGLAGLGLFKMFKM